MNIQTAPVVAIKKTSKIAEAVLSESRYMEDNRLRWMVTKKLAKTINEKQMPENFRISLSPGSIYIYIPWGVEGLKQVRQAIGDGWKFSSKYNSSDGSMTRHYYRYDKDAKGDDRYVTLSVTLDADQLNPGTCKRILVEKKERMVVSEVYKVVCEDGIETFEKELVEIDG